LLEKKARHFNMPGLLFFEVPGGRKFFAALLR
jgi:hypothetical protein